MSTSNSSSSTNGGKDPVILAAQPTLDSTLEITAQRLQSLQASQLALATQLNALTAKLENYNSSTIPPDITETIEKIHQSRKRLTVINSTLHTVQSRLIKIKERLKTQQHVG